MNPTDVGALETHPLSGDLTEIQAGGRANNFI
jgi:hypothetical protein